MVAITSLLSHSRGICLAPLVFVRFIVALEAKQVAIVFYTRTKVTSRVVLGESKAAMGAFPMLSFLIGAETGTLWLLLTRLSSWLHLLLGVTNTILVTLIELDSTLNHTHLLLLLRQSLSVLV